VCQEIGLGGTHGREKSKQESRSCGKTCVTVKGERRRPVVGKGEGEQKNGRLKKEGGRRHPFQLHGDNEEEGWDVTGGGKGW